VNKFTKCVNQANNLLFTRACCPTWHIPLLVRRGGCAVMKMSRSVLVPRRRDGQKRPQTRIPKHFGRSTTPSAPSEDASRYFLDVASTPPHGGGECRVRHEIGHLLVEVPSDFADTMTEMTAKERSQSHAFGISHLGCDFFDALIARLQEMYRAFHSQILEIGERRFAHDRFHTTSQGSFACTGGVCGFIEGKPVGTSTSCPPTELQDL